MGVWGIVAGRGFTVHVSKKKVKRLLSQHGIKTHGWHPAEDWVGKNFFVHRKDAQSALQILEKAGIEVS